MPGQALQDRCQDTDAKTGVVLRDARHRIIEILDIASSARSRLAGQIPIDARHRIIEMSGIESSARSRLTGQTHARAYRAPVNGREQAREQGAAVSASGAGGWP
jgi:hypothetical protein